MKFIIILIFIFIYSCSKNISRNNLNYNINQSKETNEYYLDYDFFREKLINKVDYNYITKNNIKTYIKKTKQNNNNILKKEWFFKGDLIIVENYKNNLLETQCLYKNNKLYIKKYYHYLVEKLFKLNVYILGNLNAVIEYFYNEKNKLYKKLKYNDKYQIVSEFNYFYNDNNNLIKEEEYIISQNNQKILTREFIAKYEKDKLISDIEYIYNNSEKFINFERFYDSNGNIISGIIYSKKYKNIKLLMNKYENQRIIKTILYDEKGEIKEEIKYDNKEERKISFSFYYLIANKKYSKYIK